LKKVLPRVINISQVAFIEGRGFLDSVLVANEVVDETRCKKKKGLVVKIDFEKAYNMVR